MTTAARASGPRLRVLRALHDAPVDDRAGRAVHRLCQAARFDRQDALAQVLARMDAEGLIRREVQGRRTYLIEITEAGRRLAGLPRHTRTAPAAVAPGRLRFDALPPGPASTWSRPEVAVEVAPGGDDGISPHRDDPPVVGSEGEPAVIPAALRELAGAAAAEVDYEVLAGVLLQSALRAVRGAEGAETPLGPTMASGAGSLGDDRAADRARIAELEAQVRMLERTNRTLAEALGNRGDGAPLPSGRPDLAHLMAVAPAGRG